MITGKLDLFGEADLDQMSAGVFRILEHTGMRVYSEEFLDSLSKAGADVERSTQTVRFPARMIEDLIAERTVPAQEPEEEQGQGTREYQPPLWIAITPFFHDSYSTLP